MGMLGRMIGGASVGVPVSGSTFCLVVNFSRSLTRLRMFSVDLVIDFMLLLTSCATWKPCPMAIKARTTQNTQNRPLVLQLNNADSLLDICLVFGFMVFSSGKLLER